MPLRAFTYQPIIFDEWKTAVNAGNQYVKHVETES